MESYVRIALKVAHNQGIFTYRLSHNEPGRDFFGLRVKVFLRNRLLLGVIIGQEKPDFTASYAIKDVVELIDQEPILSREQFLLMNFTANYYFNDLGMCVHLGVMRNEKPGRLEKESKKSEPEPFLLTPEQEVACQTILKEPHGAFLLEGVTGSGKTHVYIKAALKTLEENRSVLFLVPEISLTPQLVSRVEKGLGIKALVMHSNITPAKRRDVLFSLLKNKASVLIGARSAIFAPLKNLGLIVVDEEHDASFKQDETPRYHARDLALWRGKNEGARVILGTATPSLESSFNVQKGLLTHVGLKDRYQKARSLPEVSIIDLKERAADVDFRTQDLSTSAGQKMCILSRPLVTAIHDTLKEGNQALLFLNQRGYARFGVCYQCGTMVTCPNCSVGLTYYQKRNTLSCHQCRHQEKAMTTCRNCCQDSLRYVGLGTERLEDEVKLRFPDARVVRLDRDVVQSQQRLEKTLAAMHERTADILIGTQMIAKGHDFLHVALVGVVCADVALSMPDFRAGEKTFQLLTQVAGRAGRGSVAGRALIQTFDPTHPSIRFAKDHDVESFLRTELAIRKRFLQPPFARSALIRSEHQDEETAKEIIFRAHKIIHEKKTLNILGPAPSPIERLNNRFRFQCLALSQSVKTLHESLNKLKVDKDFTNYILKKRARLIIDVDPQHMS